MTVELLERELDAWAASSRCATLWWRDDDAERDSPALRRLVAIAQTHDVPVTIAAVPSTLDRSLDVALSACARATIVQHGYAHRNHARPGERSAELGDQRPVAARLDELAHGHERLAKAFGERFMSVLVPPWNRIATDIVAALAPAGYCGLSCFGPRAAAMPAPKLMQSNAHVDPIAWRRDRAFIGGDATIERLVRHLAGRRSGCIADEPTGLLTHHLAFAEDAWAFVDALMMRTRRHPAVAWLAAPDVFAGTDTLICGRSA